MGQMNEFAASLLIARQAAIKVSLLLRCHYTDPMPARQEQILRYNAYKGLEKPARFLSPGSQLL